VNCMQESLDFFFPFPFCPCVILHLEKGRNKFHTVKSRIQLFRLWHAGSYARLAESQMMHLAQPFATSSEKVARHSRQERNLPVNGLKVCLQ
jgi:hypothetical protein